MQAFRRITNIFTTVVLVIVLLLLFLLVGMRLFGFRAYTVLSGSMEDAISVGSVVYVREIEPEDVELMDVVTYVAGDGVVVTHRVVGFEPDENDPELVRFRTKGDANNTEDAILLHPENLIGRVSFHIPLLGYVASFIQNPKGKLITVLAVVITVLIFSLPSLISGLLGKDEKED